MDRIRINTSKLNQPRFKGEAFAFSNKEEMSISRQLDKLEGMLTTKGKAIFSVSKYNDLFSGSLKIDTHYFFAYSKGSSATVLFDKLRAKVETDILEKNHMILNKTNNYLGNTYH